MDDDGAHGSGVRLHTQSFTLKVVDLLMTALYRKFNLICTKQKNGDKYIIYITSKSMDNLKSLELPQMCSSILYKLYLKYIIIVENPLYLFRNNEIYSEFSINLI